MKRLIVLSSVLLAVMFAFQATAQSDKASKKDKKEKKGRKLWGGYDSNAIATNLVIKEAFVVQGERLLEGVAVRALVNGQEVDADTTDKNGGFEFELKFDYRYLLSFEKTGFVTKSVEIDLTQLPIDAKKKGYDLGRFRMSMVPYTEGMDVEEYKIPVARYYYNETNAMVQLDRAYLKNRKAILAKAAENNQVVVEQKQDAEDELQEEYNILIRDADIEFEAKDYKLAKEIYMEAIKLKPLAEYPREQIKVINMYLAQSGNNDEKYKSLITQGDDAMAVKDYETAKLSYKNAIKLKTTEPYPREQLKKIEQLEAELAKQDKPKEEKTYTLQNIQVSNDMKGYSNELAKKYPQGLTVEKYMEGSKSVEKRVIVEGEVGVEYKKVTHNWGGVYYFKNNKQSNQFVWQKEAIQ